MKQRAHRDVESPAKSVRKKNPKKQTRSAADVWKEEMVRAEDMPAKTYTIDGHYEEGEKVDHRSFGMGMVKKLIHPDKMEVLFEEELKVMIRGFAAPALPTAGPPRSPRRVPWARRQMSRPIKSVPQES